MMVIQVEKRSDGVRMFTCANVLPNGNCGIYERRPEMCRRFPFCGDRDAICPFPDCEWDAVSMDRRLSLNA